VQSPVRQKKPVPRKEKKMKKERISDEFASVNRMSLDDPRVRK
jgi:hypothetical protein